MILRNKMVFLRNYDDNCRLPSKAEAFLLLDKEDMKKLVVF